jgi:hypothetical protein
MAQRAFIFKYLKKKILLFDIGHEHVFKHDLAYQTQ